MAFKRVVGLYYTIWISQGQNVCLCVQIVNMSTSKTGKHGHAKLNITGIDVLTGKKYEDMTPTSHNVSVPVVTKTEYQVIGLDDGFIQMMDEDGGQIEDVAIPEGVSGLILDHPRLQRHLHLHPQSLSGLQEIGEELQSSFDAGDKDVLVTILQAPVGANPDSATWVRMCISTKAVVN